MPRHRLAMEADHYRLPDPAPAPIAAGSFALCTMSQLPGCSAEPCQGLVDFYRTAFEQACIAARSTHPERVLFALWN